MTVSRHVRPIDALVQPDYWTAFFEELVESARRYVAEGKAKSIRRAHRKRHAILDREGGSPRGREFARLDAQDSDLADMGAKPGQAPDGPVEGKVITLPVLGGLYDYPRVACSRTMFAIVTVLAAAVVDLFRSRRSLPTEKATLTRSLGS
jgi:hypothetical protein